VSVPELAVPQPGDVFWVTLDPTQGIEQAGRRPAVIVSTQEFNAVSPRVFVCPITKGHRDWPVVVPMPPDAQIRGIVLCDQLRAIDRQSRLRGFIERLPDQHLVSIRNVIGTIIGFSQRSIGT
jgi:mRNA interferase MazF